MLDEVGVLFDESMNIRKELEGKYPGINEQTMGAAATSKYLDLTKEITRKEPKLQAYLEQMDAISLQLAVDIQGARPTDQDREVIKKMLPNPLGGATEKDLYSARILAKRMKTRARTPEARAKLAEFESLIDKQESNIAPSDDADKRDYSNLWGG